MKINPLKQRLAGFTLIELLAVIAVIAILAAILIPALGKVRKQSWNAQSVSNLRQIGVALQMYTADNNGQFPVPRANPDSPNSYHSVFNWVGKKPIRAIAAALLTADRRPLNQYLGDYGPDSEVEVAHAPGDVFWPDNPEGGSMYDYFGSSYSFNTPGLTPPGANLRTTDAIYTSQIKDPSQLVVAMEHGARVTLENKDTTHVQWHKEGNYYNLLFADGHVGNFLVEPGEPTTDQYNFLNEAKTY